MKVLITEPISKEGKEVLEKAGLEAEERLNLSREELKSAIKGAAAVIVRSKTRIDREMIESADELKVIGRAGIGVDNIDVEAAKEKNIEVLNTPDAPLISVAELTFGLILACARNLKKAFLSLGEGKWEKESLKGKEIFGKTLGVVGLGRIGKEVAKRALAFGMKVIFFDPCVEGFEGAEKVDLDKLFSVSEVITLHVPLSPQTENLISKEAFSKMKDGVILVNCARGGIVDEEALYEALVGGKVFAAGLDVFKEEPAVGNKLLELPNVIATSHLGSQTVEAQSRVGVEIAERVAKALIVK